MQPERMRRELPELTIPFSVGKRRVEGLLDEWSRGLWLRPSDLKADLLCKRLRRYFLPLWLVDSDVEAVWQAEVGYNYQAASFREHYQDGRWVSHKVTETRTRWEVRLGRLRRHYDNVAVPALEKHDVWMSRLGGYDFGARKPYSARVIAESVVRAPDYDPDAAWPDAQAALDRQAATECRVAAQADHIRSWGARAKYGALNWTQMLVPAYVTCYREGDRMYPVWVNGQSGRVYGVKLMSMSKALVVSLLIGVLAVLCFLLGLVLTVVGIGILLVLFSLPLGLLAFAPLIWVWMHNRQVQRQDVQVTGRR